MNNVILKAIKNWCNEKFQSKGNFLAKLANNCLTTEEGFALDARQGTALQGEIDEINSNLGRLQVTSIARYAYGSVSLKTGTFVYTINLKNDKYYMENINAKHIPYILNANVYSESDFHMENLIDFGINDNHTIRLRIASGSNSTVTVRILVLWAKS